VSCINTKMDFISSYDLGRVPNAFIGKHMGWFASQC